MEEDTVILREWSPLTEIINQIPIKVQMGLFSKYISITCIDVVPEYLALGTNIGALFWYNRKLGQFEKFKCETYSEITCIQIVSTVDYMVACGHQNGQISIFQIPKTYPDSLPDCLKTQCTRKLERYTVTEIHSSSISTLEWSTNGMKLFSGDKNGLVVLTELDFSMHICRELAIVNESYEIVQLSYCNQYLLISTTYRCVICYRENDKWKVCQVGKKDRKNLGKFGGIFVKSGLKPTDLLAYCSRPGLRIWVADINGTVQRTLLFKELINSDIPEIPLLNPISENLKQQIKQDTESMFGRLLYFNNKYLIAYESNAVFILDSENLVVVGVISRIRRVLSVACNGDEIFILEGGRSLIRIAFNPETTAFTDENPSTIPTATLFLPISNSIKDFTTKLQSTSILTAIPTLLEPNSTSVIECSIETDTTSIVNAEEAVESPAGYRSGDESPFKTLFDNTDTTYVEKLMSNSQNLAQMVASLISNNGTINKTMYVSKYESPRHLIKNNTGHVETSEECLRKLELYDKIGEENFDSDILFKHTRRKKQKKQNQIENDQRMTNSYCFDSTVDLNITEKQPLNLSMIEIPTDFSLTPDLRSPDSIQNDIKTKEKLLSDVLYYTKPVLIDDDVDKNHVGIKQTISIKDDSSLPVKLNGTSINKSSSSSVSPTTNGGVKQKTVEMPVWVQANKPQTSGINLIQRIKAQTSRKPQISDDIASNLEHYYKTSYDPDDYLGGSPIYGLPSRDLTDESDVSLTDWEIL